MKTLEQVYLETILESKTTFAPFDEALKNPLFEKGIRLPKKLEEIGGPDSEALIVGGAVRDLVLGKEISDIDIATNISIEEIEKHFKTDEIGANKTFGIVNVHFEGDQFEVAHYRTETTYSDGRHPDKVELTNTFEGDSARRDFSWNALGINSMGEIIDYHNGLEDLKNKIVRAVGNPHERFKEDSLRILRLIRFAVKMGFEIEENTLNAAKELINLTDSLSKERVAEEIYKVAGISGKTLAEYFIKLDEIGLLEKILPELYNLKPMQHNLKHHPEGGGTVLGHVLEALKMSRSNDALTNLAIAFHDLGKATTYKYREEKGHTYYGHEEAGVPIIKEIGKRLKLSNKDIDVISYCAANHMRIHKIYELSRGKLVSMVNHPFWPYLKEVGYADEMCRGFEHSQDADFKKKIEYAENIAKEANAGGGPDELKKRIKTLINGQLLLEWIPELNKTENKIYIGKILSKIHEWIIDNNLFNLSQEEIKKKALEVFTQETTNSFKKFISN